MMRLNLQLTMGSFSLTLFGLIGVAFGMNLTSCFEEVLQPSAKEKTVDYKFFMFVLVHVFLYTLSNFYIFIYVSFCIVCLCSSPGPSRFLASNRLHVLG